MIKIAICDEEVIFAERLKKIIGFYYKERQILYKIDSYYSGKAFIADKIKMIGYQIVFLDINMKGIDGLTVAKILRKQSKETFIILVTSNSDYALDGYKVDAIRYLLKADVNFEQSVYEGLNAVSQKMKYKPCIKKLCFLEGNKNIVLEKVLYIESKLHKLFFYVLDEDIVFYTMYETLNNISEVFTNDFVRIHQSFLANLKFVRGITGNDLLLCNGVRLPIARSKRKEVLNKVVIHVQIL